MQKCILWLLLLVTTGVSGQILNAESLRRVTDTSGWSGSISAEFALRRNVNDFVVIGSDLHLQYKMNKHLVLFKNDLDFLKVEGQDLANTGISHFRYNYRFHPMIAWEAFSQGQFNKVAKIFLRSAGLFCMNSSARPCLK